MHHALTNRPARGAGAPAMVRAAADLAAISLAGEAPAAERPGLRDSRKLVEKRLAEAIRRRSEDRPTAEGRLVAMESPFRSSFCAIPRAQYEGLEATIRRGGFEGPVRERRVRAAGAGGAAGGG